jgi:hypothetical protein
MRRVALTPPDDSEELARLRAMTDDERAASLVGVMRAAAALLAANDNRDRVLCLRDGLSPESEALLARLRARRRDRS